MIAGHAPVRAAMLLGAADASRRETGLVVFDLPEHEAITRAVRVQLAPEQFEAAWNEGNRKSIPEAIADAVEALSAGATSGGE